MVFDDSAQKGGMRAALLTRYEMKSLFETRNRARYLSPLSN
jgi:hypothetical protein